MRPVFVLRPEPGWSATAQAARALGLQVRGAPLFEMEPVDWQVPDPSAYDGLLIGSANAVRLAGPDLDILARLPVHTVGEATAEAAAAAGLSIAGQGQGGLQAVLDGLSGERLHLLRLAGEENVGLACPDGLHLDTRIVYRAVAKEMPATEVATLREGGVVLLHSAAAARQMQKEFERLAIDRSAVDLVVIGPRVVEACGKGWHSIHIAAAPTDADMLALAVPLCQNL